MNKILLHCESLEESKVLREIYEQHLPFPIYHSFDERNIERLISRNVINLTVLECAEFGMDQYNLVQDLRELGYFHPIVVLPDQSDELRGAEMKEVQDRLRLHFVPKPFDDRELIGVSKKLLITKSIPQQDHQRFVTNQKAYVESIYSGEGVQSSMYNLSKGGAYCEFDANYSFQIGDMVNLKIQLGELNERVMRAKLVWKTRRGAYSGKPGLGLKFVAAG